MRISDWSSDVCSSDLGQGAHRHRPRPQAHPRCAQRRGAQDQGRLMRCLVVEDEPDIRADLARALEAAGFVVDAAADGEAAWYQGDVEDYDAVILDLGLPRLDGLTVLRRWRSAGRTFPVIVVSARGDWTEKVEGIEAGADDYLAKPFQMGELVRSEEHTSELQSLMRSSYAVFCLKKK